jgi:hypothetical protein
VKSKLLDERKIQIESKNRKDFKKLSQSVKECVKRINSIKKYAAPAVESMSEDSCNSKSEKLHIDRYILARDFFRFSSYGLLANLRSGQWHDDKPFYSDLKPRIHSDPPLGNLMAFDRGQKQLHIANNAFDVLNEKATSGIEEDQSLLTTGKRKTKNGIEASVKEKRRSISDSINEKIFQPFFTTKPTGSGTGLGLAYNTLKANKEERKVESIASKGTKFITILPIVNNYDHDKNNSSCNSCSFSHCILCFCNQIEGTKEKSIEKVKKNEYFPFGKLVN